MRVACVQLAIEGGDLKGNVSRAVDRIHAAADHDADLIVLPELFNIGYFAFDEYARDAEPLDGPSLTRVRTAAIERDVALLAGSIVEDLTASDQGPADEGLANTTVLFDRDGERLLTYRKRNLFGYGSAEQELLTPGTRLAVAEFGGFTVGVSTCSDLWVPELYRELAERGATLMLVPSAWPYPHTEHWNLLPQARAVENQAYVATVNGSGTFDEATLCGRSTVYDPRGTTLASSGDEPTIVYADLDTERIARVREEFPRWHRDRS